MNAHLNQKGMASMMEIVVASFIFLIAVFGVMSSISLLSPHTADSAKSLKEAYLAKNLLEELRGVITPTSWANIVGDLAVGSHSRNVGSYTVDWTVTSLANDTLRKIVVSVTGP